MSDASNSTQSGLKAFMCTHDDSDGHTMIIFAETASKARKDYAGVADAEYIDARATRKPQFDQYAPGPVPVLALLDDNWWFECSGCARRIDFQSEEFIEDYTPAELDEECKRQAPYIYALSEFDKNNPRPEEPSEDASAKEKNAWRDAIQQYSRARGQISIMISGPMLSRAGLRPHDKSGTIFCSADCEQNHAIKKALVNHAHENAEKEAAQRWPGCPSYTSKRYPYLTPSVEFRPEGLEFDVHWNGKDDAVFVAASDQLAWADYIASLDKEKAEAAE